jgi:hypothetical protein
MAKQCAFGGTPQAYHSGESEQFAVASSESPSLQFSSTCVGEDGDDDPVGNTFGQVYEGNYFYVVWNDQFYDDPKIQGCTKSCPAPWGHSKGMLAWDDDGDGVVMQVTTPSLPASGSKAHPRNDGNTLGCVSDDNDVLVSQHFFSASLNHDDVVKVLSALGNASVATDVSNEQIVHNGGPSDVQQLVNGLGQQSNSTAVTKDTLSNGITLISKALRAPRASLADGVGGARRSVASSGYVVGGDDDREHYGAHEDHVLGSEFGQTGRRRHRNDRDVARSLDRPEGRR